MTLNRPQPGDARLSGWQDEQAYRLKQQARDKSETPQLSNATDAQIAETVRVCAGIVGRVATVGRYSGSIMIVQRCAVCSQEIYATTADTGTFYELTGAIGTQVRLSYLKHRCPPIETALVGATYEELDEMFAACERDGQRLMDRAAEIAKLRKAREL